MFLPEVIIVQRIMSRHFLRVMLMPAILASFGQAGTKTGPAVGERIPQFWLPDQNGRVVDLKTISGPKGAMLVFYRSADW